MIRLSLRIDERVLTDISSVAILDDSEQPLQEILLTLVAETAKNVEEKTAAEESIQGSR